MFQQGYDLRETTLAAWRQAGVEPLFAIEGGEMDAVLRSHIRDEAASDSLPPGVRSLLA
jgi:hypothetical protein